MSKEEIVKNLKAGNIGKESKFCISDVIKCRDLENDLCLKVKGLGKIRLPVTAEKAKDLIDVAKLAPFGKGEETVVDTRVRNVWKIAKNKISVSKNFEKEYLAPLLEGFKVPLGLSEHGTLRAELHDFLIYEKGQFFSSHQDSEKCDEMIGTLCLVLPSKFTGGKLLVQQANQKQQFSCPKDTNITAIAFYADCRHEVEKVKSGYRVALTYNLLYEEPQRTEAPSENIVGDAFEKENKELSKSIKNYFEAESTEKRLLFKNHPKWLVFLLNHEYTEKSFSLDRLKSADRSYVAQLMASAKSLNLESYLSLMEIQETWDVQCDEATYRRSRSWRFPYGNFPAVDGWLGDSDESDFELGELLHSDYGFEFLLDSSGRKTEIKHSIPEEFICCTKKNEDLKPLDSEYEGYMGNYGNTLDRWYRRAAILLWPKEQSLRSWLVLEPRRSLEVLIESFATNRVEARSSLKEMMPLLGDRIIGRAEFQKELLSLALAVEDKKLAGMLLERLTIIDLSKFSAANIRPLLSLYGEDWFIGVLKTEHKRYRSRSDVLTNFQKITKKFKSYAKVYSWFLEYQMIAISNDCSFYEKSEKTFILANRANAIKMLRDLLAVFVADGDSDNANKVLSKLADWERLLDAATLSILLKELIKLDLGKSEPCKKIKKLAKERLTKELAMQEKIAGTYSVSEQVSCSCKDCKKLQEFLSDAEQELLIWPLAKDRRQHIHSMIEDMGISVSHTTERVGSPYKLHLKKSQDQVRYEQNRLTELRRLKRELA